MRGMSREQMTQGQIKAKSNPIVSCHPDVHEPHHL